MTTVVIALLFSCSNARGPGDTADVYGTHSDSDGEDTAAGDEGGDSTDGEEANGPVVLNEINHDPLEGPDWIEIYNGSDETIDVANWQFTDDDALEELHLLGAFNTNTVVPAGGFAHFYTENEDETEGFGIKSAGTETVYLLDESNALIDAKLPDPAIEDMSFGRVPDGGNTWANGLAPTPSASNGT
jgi:hypothetical protein